MANHQMLKIWIILILSISDLTKRTHAVGLLGLCDPSNCNGDVCDAGLTCHIDGKCRTPGIKRHLDNCSLEVFCDKGFTCRTDGKCCSQSPGQPCDSNICGGDTCNKATTCTNNLCLAPGRALLNESCSVNNPCVAGLSCSNGICCGVGNVNDKCDPNICDGSVCAPGLFCSRDGVCSPPGNVKNGQSCALQGCEGDLTCRQSDSICCSVLQQVVNDDDGDAGNENNKNNNKVAVIASVVSIVLIAISAFALFVFHKRYHNRKKSLESGETLSQLYNRASMMDFLKQYTPTRYFHISQANHDANKTYRKQHSPTNEPSSSSSSFSPPAQPLVYISPKHEVHV